jgi:hypothetical protein
VDIPRSIQAVKVIRQEKCAPGYKPEAQNPLKEVWEVTTAAAKKSDTDIISSPAHACNGLNFPALG